MENLFLSKKMIKMKEKSIGNNERQEIINKLLRRLGPRRLFDVYLKALCLKSCRYKFNRMKISDFTILNINNTNMEYKNKTQKKHNSKGLYLKLACGSIFIDPLKKGKKKFLKDNLKIEKGIYFEIIKLVKSKHKKLIDGKFDTSRTFSFNNHLIILFINEKGEWMTAGFDPVGITSPDRYFNMKCNYLLKQEYNYPNLNQYELRTNRKSSRITEHINNIYSEKQLQISVVASSHLTEEQYDRFLSITDILTPNNLSIQRKKYSGFQAHPLDSITCKTANCASFLLYVFHDILKHDTGMFINPTSIRTNNTDVNKFRSIVNKSRNYGLNELKNIYKGLQANINFTMSGYPKLNNSLNREIVIKLNEIMLNIKNKHKELYKELLKEIQKENKNKGKIDNLQQLMVKIQEDIKNIDEKLNNGSNSIKHEIYNKMKQKYITKNHYIEEPKLTPLKLERKLSKNKLI